MTHIGLNVILLKKNITKLMILATKYVTIYYINNTHVQKGTYNEHIKKRYH